MENNRLFLLAVLVAGSLIPFGLNAENQPQPKAEVMVSGDFDCDGTINNLFIINGQNISMVTSVNNYMETGKVEFILPNDLTNLGYLNGKMVCGDFDHDGFVDDLAGIYSIGYDKTSLIVWVNNDGKFTPSQWWYGPDFDANQTSFSLVSGDFDNDGYLDDVAGFYNYDEAKTKVYVWKSTGSKFEWPGTWWVGDDFNSTKIQSSLVVGDFDHDGYKDDIAGLYNYSSGNCKIFVWTSKKNRFEWPYTWYAKESFNAQNLQGSVIAGDFDQNGFEDNIAALYRTSETSTEIMVWQRDPKGFDEPSTWWYGDNQGTTTQNRIVSLDANCNKLSDQITGLAINNSQSEWNTWTAMFHAFSLPEVQMVDNTALGIEDCNGGCIANNLYGLFNMYPNPSVSTCKIELPNSGEQISVQLINMLGGVVYATTGMAGETIDLNLGNIKSGTYIVKLSGNKTELKQSLVIE